MPKPTIAGIFAGLAVSLCHYHAQAQTFGQQGDVSFAAERLMGLYRVDLDGDERNYTVGFGGPPPPCFCEPLTSPRLGIDAVVIGGLSFGSSLFVLRNEVIVLAATPRVGYAIGTGGSFGFWPRVGLTLGMPITFNAVGGFTITGEALFYGTFDHWGFLFGPTLDYQVPFPRWHVIGLMTAGMFGWL